MVVVIAVSKADFDCSGTYILWLSRLEKQDLSMACKVAVIDGGVIGLSCALALMRKGHQVALIEEGGIGHGYSWGNGRDVT
ncbi:FAD-dependent oxidoreductase [Sinorhizobium meliloti]|nr:FAD-dependent oxidoreductase [Sinorhizobium meliloti]